MIATLLMFTGLSVPQLVSDVTGSVAAADSTGTGGRFVPKQGRLVDTRNGTGGVTGPLAANTDQSFQVLGQAGIPASGVTAVLVNVTVLGSTGAGVVYIEPDGTTNTNVAFLSFDASESISNTGVVALSAAGKVQIRTTYGVQVALDVQGYFATGNGTPAPGGFVPVTPQTIYSEASVAPDTYVDADTPGGPGAIQITGAAGVPATASAVFANITVTNTQTGAVDNYLNAFPSATTAPSSNYQYFTDGKTSMGLAVDLSADGRIAIKIGNRPSSTAVDVVVDVYGYFDGQPSNAAYSTQQTRLYDSRTPSAPLAAGASRAIQVAGINGIPAWSAGMAGVAMSITAIKPSGAGGYLSVWSPDDSEPDVASNSYGGGSSSNMIVVNPGSSSSPAPNKVYVRNNGTEAVNFIVDGEGWFTNSNVLAPAVGSAGSTSGNRSSDALLVRNLTDRAQAGVNPTNGNLLATQNLLSLAGVGPGVGIAVRYNSLNDTRPTLSAGLFESQLFRLEDGSWNYTDPSGAVFNYTLKSDQTGANYGTYNVPNDLNAHLTRTVDGSPIGTVSAGATYELVFHPSQIKNVYVSDGANLKLVRTEDVTGANKITYTYGTGSNGGKLTSIADTQGRIVNFGYSSSPNPTQPTTITDTSVSRMITLAYGGPNGALSQVTDATGANTTWAYNSSGKLASITDNTTASRADFAYYPSGKASSVVYGANNSAVSGTWGFAYTTPTASQTRVTDPNGHNNDYTITSGRVIKTTDGRGIAGTASFSTHGEVTGRSTGGGVGMTYGYSPSTAGTYNLISATSSAAGGNTTEFNYGAPAGNGAVADYRPSSMKDGQGSYSTMTYNSWGQAATTAVGRPSLTGTPLGGTITNTYHGSGGVSCGGKNGQICSTVDGKGNTTTYTYNTAGNLVAVNPPAPLADQTFTYDAAGRQASAVDGRGNTRYTCYDKNDRVLQVSYSSSSCTAASGVIFTYDTAGNMKTRVDASGTTTWIYDAQMRVTSKDAAGTVNDSTATYDRVGNILTAVDGGTGAANTTTYRYDDANNLIALAEPGGSCPATPAVPNSTKCSVFTMSTTKDQRIKTQAPSGLATTMGYDGFDRLSNITTKNAAGTTTLVNQTVSYSLGGTDTALVQKLTDGVASANTTTYGYDDLDRLTGATRTGATWAYTYDRNGNRTQQNASGTVTNYGYNAADQMCWAGTGTSSTCTAPAGSTSYTYDGNGNQNLTGGSAYSVFNQLTSSTAGASQTYTYAGTSNDTRLTLGATTFTNNLFGQVTAETTGSAVTKYIREPNGTLIATQLSGTSYYYTNDYNSSVILITNQSQAKVASYTYDPFGKATVTNTVGTVGDDNPWRYATGYQDPNTGYYKLGARYYNPIQGRFTQTDPSNQEANRYAYTDNNPTTRQDPTGLQDIGCIDLGTCDAEGGSLTWEDAGLFFVKIVAAASSCWGAVQAVQGTQVATVVTAVAGPAAGVATVAGACVIGATVSLVGWGRVTR